MRRPRLGTVSLLIGVLALIVVFVYSIISTRALAACLQTWATATTQRTDALLSASNARNAALDRLIRDVAEPPARARVDFPPDLTAYIKASDAYQRQLRLHPVPPAPTLHC